MQSFQMLFLHLWKLTLNYCYEKNIGVGFGDQ